MRNKFFNIRCINWGSLLTRLTSSYGVSVFWVILILFCSHFHRFHCRLHKILPFFDHHRYPGVHRVEHTQRSHPRLMSTDQLCLVQGSGRMPQHLYLNGHGSGSTRVKDCHPKWRISAGMHGLWVPTWIYKYQKYTVKQENVANSRRRKACDRKISRILA